MKTVLITGASSGIGKELAYVYAENNYNLILVARREEQLEAIKKDIEAKQKNTISVFAMDLSKTDSAELLYQKVNEQKLKIDVLVNNAGFGVFGKFTDTDMEWEESMLILNMITLTKLSKLFAKDMVKAGSGNIVNIASTAAFQAVPSFSTYAATKAYVLSFSEAIAFELKDKNVIVTAVCPGATKSEFADTADMSEKPFVKAPTSRELAEFTYKAMLSGKTTAIHGFMNNLMVFSTRTSPRKMVTAVAAKMMK